MRRPLMTVTVLFAVVLFGTPAFAQGTNPWGPGWTNWMNQQYGSPQPPPPTGPRGSTLTIR